MRPACLNRSDFEREFLRLERIARKDLPGAELIRSADIRYAGQSYELTVPWNAADPAAPFHREHQRVYGYSNPDRAIEIVTIRVRARLAVQKPKLLRHAPRRAKPIKHAVRRIHSAGKLARHSRLRPFQHQFTDTPRARTGPGLWLHYPYPTWLELLGGQSG